MNRRAFRGYRPMLIETYRKEIFRSKCDSRVQSLHCFAHLDVDIGEVLPYLNSVLGGFTYIEAPPSVTFKAHGKLITLHSRKIAINALQSEEEADTILEWLKREINQAWKDRDRITPRFTSAPRPSILEILKHLPRTNCRECRQPTCLVFATLLAEGAKGPENCPPLRKKEKDTLTDYLAQFKLHG
jgi:ArsR family metal-binding transcriptional regulator